MIKPPDNILIDGHVNKKKPKGVELPKQVGIRFNAALQRMVKAIRKDITQQVLPIVRQYGSAYALDAAPIPFKDGYADDIIKALQLVMTRWSSTSFLAIVNQLAEDFVVSADKVNLKKIHKDFGVDIFSGQDANLSDYIASSIYDNVRLITDIKEKYLTDIQSTIMTNVRAGNRPSVIAKMLTKQYGVASKRAKFIARDQTAKVNGDLSAKRQIAAGFEYFQWVDSGDRRVRDRHHEIANKVTEYGKGVYRWDNLPLSNQGVPIKPGQDYQCRCVARPVSRREVEKNVTEGKTRPGVKR